MTTLPLDGVRVLDLTRAIAGPMCTMLLGDLGADVIKVEPLPGGEMTRFFQPFVQGESAFYMAFSRNKRSVAVEMRSPEGLKLLRRMALASDIVVDNFRPGVMEEMGLGHEDLSRERPDVITCSVTGFGRVGPYRDRAGVDQITQGMSGLMSVTGHPDQGPLRAGIPVADVMSGMFAALAVVGAHVTRLTTGKGTRVDLSLLESMVGAMGFQAQRYLSAGEIAQAQGNDHPLISPCGAYEAKDGSLNMCVATEKAWRRVCEVLELGEETASDPRFATNAARKEHNRELTELINSRLHTRTRQEWTEVLNDAGIPTGPIYNMGEALEDPQVQALGIVQSFTHTLLGPMRGLSAPFTYNGVRPPVRIAPPLLGEYTRPVLEELGYSAEEIERLHQEGVVASAPVGQGQAAT